ncbi:MAG: hypothetical protein NTW03_17790, partial [Verrucomicrobia bacterium]|nr:hypothetical protein [Verrucomicrobiota bacterium]
MDALGPPCLTAIVGLFQGNGQSTEENVNMKGHLVTITLCLLATVAWAQDPTPKAAVVPAKSPAMRVIISTDFPPLDVIPVKGVKKGDPPEK